MSNDIGVAADAAGPAVPSGPEPAAQSQPEALVPNALKDAVGSIVSMIADARDVFPDDQVTLEAVTDAVNELYGCIEDGVFGPLQCPLADDTTPAVDVSELIAVLEACADSLESELLVRYRPHEAGRSLHPFLKRRFDRDMSDVIQARAVIAKARGEQK